MRGTPPRRKRRKAAPAGRVLATGLSASAFFGVVTAMAEVPPRSDQPQLVETGGPADVAATLATGTSAALEALPVPTTVVVRVERRVIVVPDDAAPSGPIAPIPAPAPARPAPSVAPTPAAPAAPPPAPASPPPTAAPAPPKPKCSGSKC